MLNRRLLAVGAGLAGLVGLIIGSGCAAPEDANPPAEGFNAAGSDAAAMAVADETMIAMGGRQAWDNTRFITWRFFGGRLHVWDKFTGKLRYEDKDLVVLMNLDTEQGQAWRAGQPITDPAELTKTLAGAKGAWINDSYWLVMPYKLKDSGVTLTYLGEKPNSAGAPCDVLQLTFAGVGRTPQNKYHVYVGKSPRLVTEWTYWADAAVDEPRSLGVWANWQSHGNILLSDNRGNNRHTDVAVLDTLPESVFTAPTPFVLSTYQP
ncbi:hypothetical protein [Synoicihabitans lomoniglobus]|uniref:Lipoprotein n=1 Tax=Synoicihabitans lomoniglobus TaxID=2909285 RepID=A0AAE9ZY16_9BACT|nr:hypothetical protein [Opitutaceae bacterium LMO-M01]WED64673.1 hypothetical protein PXH66_20205 [Opitutaceae bacterium LMO-M01]